MSAVLLNEVACPLAFLMSIRNMMGWLFLWIFLYQNIVLNIEGISHLRSNQK